MRLKTYNYLIDDNDKDKKEKGTKQCVIKQKLVITDYKNCLEATQLESKIKHLQKKVNIDSLKDI